MNKLTRKMVFKLFFMKKRLRNKFLGTKQNFPTTLHPIKRACVLRVGHHIVHTQYNEMETIAAAAVTFSRLSAMCKEPKRNYKWRVATERLTATTVCDNTIWDTLAKLCVTISI